MSAGDALAQLPWTAAMCGLIWFVQIVHYPLFARVGEEGYPAFQQAHMRLTTFVVLPLMFAELATCVWSLRALEDAGASAWWGAALLAVIWASTFFLQVPLHGRLSERFDARVHRRLVASNWIRTSAWSARLLLLWWPLLSAA